MLMHIMTQNWYCLTLGSNLRTGLYDLVDIMMPKMDGFELYEWVKKVDSKVKVCFLTASKIYYEKIGEQTLYFI
jgi:two-component SAPR family response regulator